MTRYWIKIYFLQNVWLESKTHNSNLWYLNSYSRILTLGFLVTFFLYWFYFWDFPSLAPNQIPIFFPLPAPLPLMAAFSFSSSPDLQSFIISVIQRSPSTCCNICLEVLHMSCLRDSTKWKDWEQFHLFTSVVSSSCVCQQPSVHCHFGSHQLCTVFSLFRHVYDLYWSIKETGFNKITHCCSPDHSGLY